VHDDVTNDAAQDAKGQMGRLKEKVGPKSEKGGK